MLGAGLSRSDAWDAGRKAGRETRATGQSLDGGKAARKPRRRVGDMGPSGTEELEVGRQRKDDLPTLVVVVEKLVDGLERHLDILRDGQRESAATERESKRQPPGYSQDPGLYFSQGICTVPSSWMNLFMICDGEISCCQAPEGVSA